MNKNNDSNAKEAFYIFKNELLSKIIYKENTNRKFNPNNHRFNSK